VQGPMRTVQEPPALASNHGYIAVVAGARHDALLGPEFSPSVIAAIDFVRRAAGKPAQPLTVAGGASP
jgi:hypothetical protein